MRDTVDDTAYGIAAFAVIEGFMNKAQAKGLLSKSEILEILDHAVQVESAKGIASNRDADTGAAFLLSNLATAVRHRP